MKTNLGKTVVANLLFAVTLGLSACTAQSVAAAASEVRVELADRERISVRADQASLDAVIAELARQTGLEVVWLVPRGVEAVTTHLDGISLESAIGRLLDRRNHSLFLFDGRPSRVVIGGLTARAKSLAEAEEERSRQSQPPVADLPAVDMEHEHEAVF